MLLEDAKSKEQVQEALDAGDDELRQDIEDTLEDAKRSWENRERGVSENLEPFDMTLVVEDPAFVDHVIFKSPAVYSLEMIPREAVEQELLDVGRPSRVLRGFRGRTEYGPFYLDNNGGDYFSFKVELTGDFTFWGSDLPKNSEFIPSALAREFWESLGDEFSWSYTDRLDRYEDNYAGGPGESVYVESSQGDFTEWCRDLIATYVQGAIKKHPERAKEIFYAGLAEEDKDLSEKLKAAKLPDEEILDFAATWFESEDNRSDALDAIRDYFGMIEGASAEPRETIAEFSKQDIVDMGIKSGTLYENAPWKLIKLHPSDLRLERTRMGHCVGDGGMGYIKAVSDGEIEIWSLRSRDNKPRFTLEVDSGFYTADDGSGGDLQTLTPAYYRARAIKQLKGKANRTPGYVDRRQTGGIRFPDEVFFWAHAFNSIGVNPEVVEDFDAFREEKKEPFKLQANGEEVCTGFDLPYRPRVRQNRRRRTSCRRSSKMRT